MILKEIILKVKDNYCILPIGISPSRQKLGIISENKVPQKLKLSKNVNNKEYASKLILFNEKKTRKILIIFDIEN